MKQHVGHKENLSQSCTNTEDCERTSHGQSEAVEPDAEMHSNGQGPCNGRHWAFLSIREVLRNVGEETAITSW